MVLITWTSQKNFNKKKQFSYTFNDVFIRKDHKDLIKSYSQEGEDLILARFMDRKSNGFFIDIGAHHPMRFSNTYKFYRQGWRGINIDAMPGSMEAFRKLRPEDINLEIPVSNKPSILKYNIFNESALNTSEEVEAQKKDRANGFYILSTLKIRTVTIKEILDTYLPSNIKEIDFLTIDIESMDLNVLNFNDWDKYQSIFILIEQLKNNLEEIIKNSEIFTFMKSKVYSLIARSYNTSFYRKWN